MKRPSLVLGVAIAAAAAVIAAGLLTRRAPAGSPPWAYPVDPPGAPAAAGDDAPRRVPGSAAAYTGAQLLDLFDVPDWHPEAHPPMPELVARGRRPSVRACAYCHLPTGLGRPENAGLAGLPARYIVAQLADLRSGARRSSVPDRLPVRLMVEAAEGCTDADAEQAAAYFAALPRRPSIRVVEAERAPVTRAQGWRLVAVTPAATAPLDGRVVEVAEDEARAELRDAASGFVAYVPAGSVARGEALARADRGEHGASCTTCHGEDLRGLGLVPGLAGRSPSYLARQLHDILGGARRGPALQAMRENMPALTAPQIVDLAAYAASRPP